MNPKSVANLFLSTPSVWRATNICKKFVFAANYFYPRPPCGGRPASATSSTWSAGFLSTPSVWRATVPGRRFPPVQSDFYPRPPCGGRPIDLRPDLFPHLFLSTPSVWRATWDAPPAGPARSHFYPRPPCGGRHSLPRWWPPGGWKFLSTPSVWRATDCFTWSNQGSAVFLSTPSVWRATGRKRGGHCRSGISIHALRVEGDREKLRRNSCSRNFYPRPPCGGRLLKKSPAQEQQQFLSTPSVWRATVSGPVVGHGDREFLSTPSVWRATRYPV